jgi:ABC-2 type transport system permease protein
MTVEKEARDIQIIAIKEIMDNVRSKRFIFIGFIYFVLALLLAGIIVMEYGFMTDMYPGQSTPVDVLTLLNSFSFILMLLAVVIAADTISIEKRYRTIYQLLSKPVERRSVILGKFTGCLAIMALLFMLSALSALAIAAVFTGLYPTMANLGDVFTSIISMILLFAVYIALGILISAITKNPLVSIIIGVVAWLGLTFIDVLGNALGGLGTDFVGGREDLVSTFDFYPLYAKLLVWVDPSSHNIVNQLLTGAGPVTNGLPIWANLVMLLVTLGVLLGASVIVFDRQDL